MSKNKRSVITIYIQKGIREGYNNALKQKKIGPGTYINQILLQALSEEGFI